MIVIDINILLYAYDSTAGEHRKARAWLENVFSGDEPIGLPWQTLSGFIRILTYPGVIGERFTLQQAVAIVDQWLEMPHVHTLSPGDRHWRVFREFLLNGQARGKLASDAALAAVTVENGGVLYTNDRDFARFPDLRWINPLAAS